MEVSQSLLENASDPTIAEGDDFSTADPTTGDDDFFSYEEIEAPKFVDFAHADRYRPDDRYWFCMRVGCDQKHEEELDPEEISKNFVLRVMAARSPNVRLRKALNRKCPSSNMKCPLTAPAKSSNPRLSKPPVVSSVSRKLWGAEVKVSPVNLNSKPKQSVLAAAKCLTTPRNKKSRPITHPFCSVRNPKATKIELPKDRGVVAKALIFKSPRKVARTKISQELKTPLTKICKGIKQHEINGSGKKLPRDIRRDYSKPWCSNAAKQLSSKVKIPASGLLQNCKDKGAKPSLRLKLKRTDGHLCYKGVGNDSSDMEVDEKSQDGSLEGQNLANSGGIEEFPMTIEAENFDSKNCREVISSILGMPPMIENAMDESGSQENNLEEEGEEDNVPKHQAFHEEGDEVKEASENKEKLKFSGDQMSKDFYPKLEMSKGDSQDTEDKENNMDAGESDAKENASASDSNRGIDHNSDHFGGKVLGRHEACKSTRTATGAPNKALKECAQGVKYRRPKPTNPKPFRLRTDERGVLKEANMERRLQNFTPQNENATDSRVLSANSQRRQGNEPFQINGIGATHTPKVAVQEKTGTLTSQTRVMKSCMKPRSKNNDASKKAEDKLKKPKCVSSGEVIRPNGAEAIRKKMVSSLEPHQLSVIRETHSTISRSKIKRKPSKWGATQTTKISTSANDSRASSRERTRSTIPKEPNFHRVHVPKSLVASGGKLMEIMIQKNSTKQPLEFIHTYAV